jgi:hypothetical protein
MNLKISEKRFNFIKENKTKNCFFIVARNRYLNDLCNIFGSIVLNKDYKFNPIVISDKQHQKINLFEIFKLNRTISIFRIYFIILNPLISIKALFETIQVMIKIKSIGFMWLIEKYYFLSTKIGDLVYDTYTRNNHTYVNPSLNFKFFTILFKATFRTIKLRKITNLYNPKCIFIGTEGYSHNDGIISRIAISKGIPVFECMPKYLTIHKKEFIDIGPDHLKFFYNKNKLDINRKIIEKHFIEKFRYIKESKYTDVFFLANNYKKRFDKKLFLKEIGFNKNFKKIVLIAPHAFSDAPHIVGKIIFRDYYNHLEETLKYIKEKYLNNVLWVVRSHPAHFFFDEIDIFDDLIKKFQNNYIVRCPKENNTKDLIEIFDHVITTRGSVGIEFATHGKIPILGGIAAYSHLGFTKDPKNKKEYFNILKNINKLKNLNKAQVIEAKKAMYMMDNALHRNSLKKGNFFNTDKGVKKYKKGLSKNKITINQIDYISSTIKNLDKYEITEDKYYLSLKKEISKNL